MLLEVWINNDNNDSLDKIVKVRCIHPSVYHILYFLKNIDCLLFRETESFTCRISLYLYVNNYVL